VNHSSMNMIGLNPHHLRQMHSKSRFRNVLLPSPAGALLTLNPGNSGAGLPTGGALTAPPMGAWLWDATTEFRQTASIPRSPSGQREASYDPTLTVERA